MLFLPVLATANNRVALVIGNANYESVGRLDNPRNDAIAVSEALRKHGFSVFTQHDLDLGGMYRTLDEFRSKAETADVAMVYYAGHGIEVRGVNYLIPVNATLPNEDAAPAQTVTVQTLLSQISGAKSLKIVVLDACRNNPFNARMIRLGKGRNVGRGLAKIETTSSDTLIAYAAAAGETTPDGTPGGNSPFSSAFIAALETPPRDVRRLFGTVRDLMRETVPGAEPFVYNSLGGAEYVINPAGLAAEPAVTEPIATGATEEHNVEAQELLVRLGLYTGAITNELSGSAEEELRDFQKETEIAVTGRADPQTLAALRAAARFAALSSPIDVNRVEKKKDLEPVAHSYERAEPTPSVQANESPAIGIEQARAAEEALNLTRKESREVQRRLTLLGFDTRGVDGIFGDGTRGAILSWQKVNQQGNFGYLSEDQIKLLENSSKNVYDKWIKAQHNRTSSASKSQREKKNVAITDSNGCLWLNGKIVAGQVGC